MSELLWSDPQPFPGRSPSKRGVGMSFGPDVTKRFLDLNGLGARLRLACRVARVLGVLSWKNPLQRLI